MAKNDVSRHGMWSSRWLFVLAAAGSAVGLGNIWKFPYVAGENGGGAFVLLYLGCVALIGIPIMMAEVLLGREGRQSPINTMRTLVRESKASGFWVVIGWMGALAGFLILSYYSVVAGWAVYYVWRLGSGEFVGADGSFAASTFDDFLTDPWMLLIFHTLFIAITAWVVGRGVSKGLEGAIKLFMPLLLGLLIVLLVYSATSEGFAEGASFMLSWNPEALSGTAVLAAMGQAFFTLSLGMGAIMAYGAYVPAGTSITSTVTTIALLDTFVAVAAGLAIFPIVFANGLEPGSGPGLMFVTVPLAFGQMSLGVVFGTLFFLLVTFAAFTSAISLTEPALSYMVEEYNAKRPRAAISLGVICWLLGVASVLSFNHWADMNTLWTGMNPFDLFNFLTDKVMLPLGGLLIALFVGWVLPARIVREQVALDAGWQQALWQLLIRFVAPLGVIAVFVYTLLETFGLLGVIGFG